MIVLVVPSRVLLIIAAFGREDFGRQNSVCDLSVPLGQLVGLSTAVHVVDQLIVEDIVDTPTETDESLDARIVDRELSQLFNVTPLKLELRAVPESLVLSAHFGHRPKEPRLDVGRQVGVLDRRDPERLVDEPEELADIVPPVVRTDQADGLVTRTHQFGVAVVAPRAKVGMQDADRLEHSQCRQDLTTSLVLPPAHLSTQNELLIIRRHGKKGCYRHRLFS